MSRLDDLQTAAQQVESDTDGLVGLLGQRATNPVPRSSTGQAKLDGA